MALPIRKRPLREDFVFGATAKRIKRIERIQRERKPEMKFKDFTINSTTLNNAVEVLHITNISEGDAHENRSGRLIKLHRIEVRGGTLATSAVGKGYGVSLETRRNTTDPVVGDYSSAIGGFVDLTKAISWAYQLAGAGESDTNIHIVHSFKYPMKVHYSAAEGTSVVRNKTFLVLHNRTSATANFSFSIRVWFTDV